MPQNIRQTTSWYADVDTIAEGLELAAERSTTVDGPTIVIAPMSQNTETGEYKYHIQITGQQVVVEDEIE